MNFSSNIEINSNSLEKTSQEKNNPSKNKKISIINSFKDAKKDDAINSNSFSILLNDLTLNGKKAINKKGKNDILSSLLNHKPKKVKSKMLITKVSIDDVKRTKLTQVKPFQVSGIKLSEGLEKATNNSNQFNIEIPEFSNRGNIKKQPFDTFRFEVKTNPKTNLKSGSDKSAIKDTVLSGNKKIRSPHLSKENNIKRIRISPESVKGAVRENNILNYAKQVIDTSIVRQDWTRYAVFDNEQLNNHRIVDIEKVKRGINLKQVNRTVEDVNPKEAKLAGQSLEGIRDKSEKTIKSPSNIYLKEKLKQDGRLIVSKSGSNKQTASLKKNENVNKNIKINANSKTPVSEADSKVVNLKSSIKTADSSQLNSLSLIKVSIPNNKVSQALPVEITRSILDFTRSIKTLNNKTFTIKIYPPELGSINLRFTEVREVINVRMNVESETVYKTINVNIQEMKNVLTSAGLNIDKFEVQYDSRDRDMEFKDNDNNPEGSALNKNHQNSKQMNKNGITTNEPSIVGNVTKMNSNDNYVTSSRVNCLA